MYEPAGLRSQAWKIEFRETGFRKTGARVTEEETGAGYIIVQMCEKQSFRRLEILGGCFCCITTPIQATG